MNPALVDTVQRPPLLIFIVCLVFQLWRTRPSSGWLALVYTILSTTGAWAPLHSVQNRLRPGWVEWQLNRFATLCGPDFQAGHMGTTRYESSRWANVWSDPMFPFQMVGFFLGLKNYCWMGLTHFDLNHKINPSATTRWLKFWDNSRCCWICASI